MHHLFLFSSLAALPLLGAELTKSRSNQENPKSAIPLNGKRSQSETDKQQLGKTKLGSYGKITANRVRVRLQPDSDSPILYEVDQGTPVVIVDTQGEFFAIKPTHAMKAYIFRLYVLDDKVEGDRVNVRLAPSPDAPVLTQLTAGTPIHGVPSPANNKWLEINWPEEVKIYVHKDYVELIQRSEFEKLRPLQQPLPQVAPAPANPTITVAPNMPRREWVKMEQEIAGEWLKNHPDATLDHYKTWQQSAAVTLEGEIKPYTLTNAPGDWLLRVDGRTIAILYSAEVDLSAYNGNQVRLKALPRPNHSFAYPTYTVIAAEPLMTITPHP